MSSSNCCFLTCIQVFQEAGQVVWYSHLFQNFPQFIVIHTVKTFSVVNEAKVGVFLEFPHFLYDPLNSPCLKYLPWLLFSWLNSEYCIMFDVKRNYFSIVKGPDSSWERRQEFWVHSRTTGSFWRHVTAGCPLFPKACLLSRHWG